MISTIPQCKALQNSESSDGNCSRNYETDCMSYNSSDLDSVDNPLLKRLIAGPTESEEEIFQAMKYECNRLYSFRNKWPVNEISPQSLASAGFFYLQYEDRVQCPFCGVTIFNWTSVDKPLREHMKKSPKCPFLMGTEVGNVPLISRHKQQGIISKQQIIINKRQTTRNHSLEAQSGTSVNYKPKHPRMADTKRRLLTYSGWQLTAPSPQQLAECGLYYSGVADVVVCFFCGGSLGNWEPHDDPWMEHTKFFPDCAFLSLHKNKKSNIIVGSCGMESMKPKSNSSYQLSLGNVTSEVVKEAMKIFPKELVLDAVKKKNGSLFSLQELCDCILQSNHQNKVQPNAPAVSSQIRSNATIENNSSVNPDFLLCKICMDNERGALFQPCGHLVACWNCAQMISNCPLCRKPIVHVVRAYYS